MKQQVHSKTFGKIRSKDDPHATWECLSFLTPKQVTALHDIASESQACDQFGLGEELSRRRGTTVLFAGPNGTGKTMAADVIAGELRADLYRIDLSRVVSKYIGETEKNLNRIFNEVEDRGAILFFDEADALFGKRSEVKDAHDRWANIEVAYLLQRLADHEGVVILACNLKQNLDEAFIRRIRYIIDFPAPDADERDRIWKSRFPTQE